MPLNKPVLTLTSRLLIRLIGAVRSSSCARSAANVIVMFAVIVGIECFSGAVGVGFLYLAACGLAVWCVGERGGLAISVLAAIAGAVAKQAHLTHFHVPPPTGWGADLWHLAARLISFAVVAIAANGLRGILALERWRGSHDGLTGALNKVTFEREVRAAVELARADDRGLVFAYMDLDGFKAVNDEHGHSAGDRVLSAFAAAASAAIRETDLFGRLGGDEFAALMVLPDASNGMPVAEALHKRLTAILLATGFNVTCSMGAVVMTGSEAALDDGVMEQADTLMYEAKRTGKNTLRVARGSPISTVLRATYLPTDDDDLQHLLSRIDVADRRLLWSRKRAA